MTTDPNLKVQVDWEAGVIDIRQSAIQTFLDCRRHFYWAYMRGLEYDYAVGPRPATTADVGSAVHAGMAAWYRAKGDIWHAGVRPWLLEDGNWPDGDIPDNLDLDLVRIMLEGHISDLAESGDDIGETTVAVEEAVVAEVKSVSGWTVRVHGRIDRRVETDDGLRIIDDLKSVGPFAEVDTYLPQLMRYSLLVRQATGWRADRVRTTQIRRVKRTGDGPFYQRLWVPVNEDMYEAAAASLRGTLRDIVQCIEAEGPWYEHRTGECGWKCRVEDICRAQVRGDDPEIIVDIHYREKVPTS